MLGLELFAQGCSRMLEDAGGGAEGRAGSLTAEPREEGEQFPQTGGGFSRRLQP